MPTINLSDNSKGILVTAKELIKGEKGDPGKDGYTPIKGVDYFDGKDGYTPVKGVDYFDGATGPIGPVGPTGPQGETGPKGDAYIITEEDKTEIAGIVETEGFYTKSEIDDKLENFEGGGGFEPDNDSIVLTEEETLAVNQNNLYVKGGSQWVLSERIEPFPMDDEFNLIEVEADLDDWFANLQNGQKVQFRLRTEEMGFGGGVRANIERSVEVDGTVYDYYINLSGALGPQQIEQLGITAMAVGYNNGVVSFIIERNPAIEMDDIVRVELGDEVRVNSLAHYWIGRNKQWKISNSGDIEINEDYINELIDIKLDEIPNAEGVEV